MESEPRDDLPPLERSYGRRAFLGTIAVGVSSLWWGGAAWDRLSRLAQPATGVVIPLQGDLAGTVLLLFDGDDAATLCSLLGVEPDSDVGLSALGEIGNILGTCYIQALGQMTGLTLEPTPPHVATDMLGAIVATVLAAEAATADVALLLDSDLQVEGEPCSLSFMLLPEPGGVRELLTRLGL